MLLGRVSRAPREKLDVEAVRQSAGSAAGSRGGTRLVLPEQEVEEEEEEGEGDAEGRARTRTGKRYNTTHLSAGGPPDIWALLGGCGARITAGYWGGA
jgi:hypothetical protein